MKNTNEEVYKHSPRDVELHPPGSPKIFKPAGCSRTVKWLSETLQIKSCALIFDCGGTGKTAAARWFIAHKLKRWLCYVCLPLAEEDMQRLYNLVLSLVNSAYAVGLVLDEMDKLGSTKYLGVLGWILKILDMQSVKVIIITNRPWIIKEQYFEVWRRIMDDGAIYYTDPPHTKNEMLHIINAVIKKLNLKERVNLTYEEKVKLATIMAKEGWNFKSVEEIFGKLKSLEKINYRNIMEIKDATLYNWEPPLCMENIRVYLNELHKTGI
ncbi:MAG: hypothetical protein QXR19_16875, partial [Candidatus Jordarchaeaceae archaeon]